ncbi:SNF2 family N-terminal domain-containing protein [Amanita rubescens]|nr:SNF2 family N-terminal domain-containing protein [Amanita rubescens]
MYSSTEAASSNKRAALEQLRLGKTLGHNSSSVPVVPPRHSPYASSPPPSRDSAISSRFFPVTPSENPIVLVPNSSPLPPDPQPLPYYPHSETHIHDVHSLQPSRPPNVSWIHPQWNHTLDPLSAPTGFVFNASANASFRNGRFGTESATSSVIERDEGPPRKRQNRGPLEDAFDGTDVLSSPEIRRATQRRRIASGGTDIQSVASDDSLPEGLAISGSSTSRLTKMPATPSPGSSSATGTVTDEAKFIRFKFSMPQYTSDRIHAAWVQANGDEKMATALLGDPNWAPASPSNRSQQEAMGRVQELDEESRARRAAAKEKGKKSMIYANRSNLENNTLIVSTPPTSKRPLEISPLSPETPIIRPQRKRLKKMVVDSDTEASESDNDARNGRSRLGTSDEMRALNYLNTASPEALQELTGCSPEQANAIIKLRPFDYIDDLNAKLGQGKKKAGPAGISPRLFEECTALFQGYGAVDDILEDCERIGASLRAAIASWTVGPTNDKGKAKQDVSQDEDDGALSLRVMSSSRERPKDFLTSQPALLSDSVQLKEYQVLGVNWLNLLYRRNLSCILADEMGLGKTIQVISFFAQLKERGNKGPHLVVVPSSTLENWCREFARFAPSISIQTYYAGKEDRPQLRQTLLDTQLCTSKLGKGWEVLITTYNLAQGDERDRKFFRKLNWDCCVYDEGHVLKNFQSQRYQSLLRFGSNWRLLLTGTPLQNNLQELVSLMNFILPNHFADSLDSLRAIFKVKGDSKVTLLSQERISRAKKMMTPFVLRRRKDQVLRDLPNKTERIEWCEMTALQKSIYTDALQRSRKTIIEAEAQIDETADDTGQSNGRVKNSKKKPKAEKNKVYSENSTNVLMDLRKAASHPMLFRTKFTDNVLSGITKQLLKEPDFKKRGAVFDLVKEDMSVMTDAELQVFCATYKSTRKFLQKEDCYLEAGKVKVLLDLLARYNSEGRKILIFSQFTQILDILQAVLKYKQMDYLVLTGSTPVDVRQTLVDEFAEDSSIPVFLLSTKAGGMGINLTAASVVIMFDQDFNPHNDRQAQDRAYRIGQKRDVEVVKLISRGTIEEDMLRLGQTKLALDEAVAGDTDDKGGESAPEREMKTSLLRTLRQQLEKQETDTNQT